MQAAQPTKLHDHRQNITELPSPDASVSEISSFPSYTGQEYGLPPPSMWLAENGRRRFRCRSLHRIERAQDALSRTEECVYDWLWGWRAANPEPFRLRRAGYTEIAVGTGISKRNVIEILHRLVRKGFLAVEIPADPLRKACATYRVNSYRSSLDWLARKGWEYVARAGHGVQLVRPEAEIEADIPIEKETATRASTVDHLRASTVDALVTPTVDALAPHPYIGNYEERKQAQQAHSSSSVVLRVISSAARKWGVILDDDAILQLIQKCRTGDQTATEEEIAQFTALKICQVKNNPGIRNMTGLLLKAVPAYFAWPATEVHAYREQRAGELAEYQPFEAYG
jgi:hypothetical protein